MEENQEPGFMAGHFLCRLVAPSQCCTRETLARKRANPSSRGRGFPMTMRLRSNRGGFLGTVSVGKAEAIPFQLGALIAAQTIHLSGF
jgi:hypothetical protein